MEYVLKFNHVMISNTGWWYTYPSETYESQLECLFPIYGKHNPNVPKHQPNICFYHQSLYNYEEIVTINDSQNTHIFNMAHQCYERMFFASWIWTTGASWMYTLLKSSSKACIWVNYNISLT